MRQVEGEGFMFSTILEEGLTYGQAMDKLIHEKKKVSRAIWKGYWFTPNVLVEDPDSGSVEDALPTIVAVLRDKGGMTTATPYNEDKFATDWMVVE